MKPKIVITFSSFIKLFELDQLTNNINKIYISGVMYEGACSFLKIFLHKSFN